MSGYVIYGKSSVSQIIEQLINKFIDEVAEHYPAMHSYSFLSLSEAGGPTDAVRRQQIFYANRHQYTIKNIPRHSSANISQYIIPGTTLTVQQYVLSLDTLSTDGLGQPIANPIQKIKALM